MEIEGTEFPYWQNEWERAWGWSAMEYHFHSDLIDWVDSAWSGGGNCSLHHPSEVLFSLTLAFSTSGSLPVSVFRAEVQIQVLRCTGQIPYHSTMSQPDCLSLKNACLPLEICLFLIPKVWSTQNCKKPLEKTSAPLCKQDPSDVPSRCWSWTCTHDTEGSSSSR